MKAMSALKPTHFLWRMEGDVAVIQLNRPERKNPLTFDSYAELRDTFRALRDADDVKAVVFLPHGGNFCSGGDVHDIIGPLVATDMKVSQLAPGRSSRWLPTFAWQRPRQRRRFYLPAWASPAATWARAPCCRA